MLECLLVKIYVYLELLILWYYKFYKILWFYIYRDWYDYYDLKKEKKKEIVIGIV